MEGISTTPCRPIILFSTLLCAVGNGLETGVTQGPLINAAAVQKVTEHVGDALGKGAHILCGGRPHALGGSFFEPTILTNVRNDMKLFTEETFGPVAPLVRFHTEEDAIQVS